MAKDTKAVIMLLAAGVMWSFSGVLVKVIQWDPLAVAAVRSFIGGLIQFAFLLYCLRAVYNQMSGCHQVSRGLLPFTLSRIFLSHNRVQWLGALAAVLNTIALVFAFKTSSAANAVFLHKAGVVLVAFLSGPVLNQRPRKHDWITLAIAVPGIFLLAADGLSLGATSGTILGVLCGITSAVKQLCLGLRTKEVMTGYEAFENSILANAIVAIIGVPAIFFSQAAWPTTFNWYLLIALGIVPWGVPNVLYLLGIKHVPVLRALILGLSDPVLTVVWPLIFLGEAPTVLAVCGMVTVGGAIVYQGWWAHRIADQTRSAQSEVQESDV
jgi:drug/metabolite transporter (DMT)-like permease